MPTDMVRHQSPEEVELNRKRDELAAVRAELAERELELADIRAQLKSFGGRYLREVGVLYAELDEYEARITERETEVGSKHSFGSRRPQLKATQVPNTILDLGHLESAESTCCFLPES